MPRLLAFSLIVGPVCNEASGQDLTRRLATADRFFTEGILPENLEVFVDPTFDGALKGVFGYSLSMGVTYDSNVNLSATNEEADVFFNINPSISYSSDPEGDARHAITAYYSPNPTVFRSDSATGGSDSSFNHRGGLSYNFQGSRTAIYAFLNLEQASGSDRFAGGYSEGTVFSYGLTATYQLAPRTSVYSSLSSSHSTYETAGQQGGDFVSGSIGASWAATQLLSFGPSVRGTWSDSSSTGEITTLSINLNGEYDVTERINLYASVGVQGTRYSQNGGDDETGLTGALAFDYKLSELWTWSGSISNANLPSPTIPGFVVDDWLISTALRRSLDIGYLRASASYSISTYESAGQVARVGLADDNYYEISLRYGRPFFSDRISFSSGLSYSAGTGGSDWTKWEVSCSWTTVF